MIELKDNYQDDVLDSEKNQLRKYNMIHNDDGTVSFVDATVYSQNGDNFGAKDVNDIVARIGEVSKAENIAYDGDKSVQGAIDEVSRTLGYTVTSKNYLPYPYYNTTLQSQSMHFTDNGDGTVTIKGTATGDAIFQLRHRTNDYLTLKADTYTVTGVPKNSNGIEIRVLNSDGEIIAFDEGNGDNLTINETKNIGSYIFVASGTTVNNLVIEPMISKEGGEYEPYVADLKSLVCNVEKIRENKEIQTSTTGAEHWSYTAKKRCLVNISVTFGHYSGRPRDIKAYISGKDYAFVNHRNTSDDQSHMSMPINVCLEKGEKLQVYAIYNNETTNRVIVEGYVQYLE